MNISEINVRTGRVVDAAMRVHTALGPGLLESAYEACLAHELRKRGMRVETQVPLSVLYDGQHIEAGYRLDLLVDGVIVVELKAVPKMHPLFDAQILSYLRLSKYPIGLLINFQVSHLKDGIKRFANL